MAAGEVSSVRAAPGFPLQVQPCCEEQRGPEANATNIMKRWMELEDVVNRAWNGSTVDEDGTLCRSDPVNNKLLERNEGLITAVIRVIPHLTPSAGFLQDLVCVFFNTLRREHALTPHAIPNLRIKRLLTQEANAPSCGKCAPPLALLDAAGLKECAGDDGWSIKKMVSRIRLLKRRNQTCRNTAVERMKALVIIKNKSQKAGPCAIAFCCRVCPAVLDQQQRNWWRTAGWRQHQTAWHGCCGSPQGLGRGLGWSTVRHQQGSVYRVLTALKGADSLDVLAALSLDNVPVDPWLLLLLAAMQGRGGALPILSAGLHLGNNGAPAPLRASYHLGSL